MKPIIQIEHIDKIFRIGSIHSYQTFRESIVELLLFKKQSKKYIKALDDITFDVYEGEKIGIIGRNGAGKSTLLKILSKITPPTKGRAILRGKVASLLEVGTGFHGELTGRENIFLNGAILGMKRNEIAKNLDEIVAFAGVEKFLDTPVKHYSSGMQLRLAFSVAAHLVADILLFDEVLAVGDAEFQKKSLGKMDEISNSGRTILFVSHNMTAIKSFCSRSVVINQGKIEFIGNTNEAISFYINEKHEKFCTINKKDIYGHCNVNSVYVKARNKSIEEDIDLDDEIEISTELEVYNIPSDKFHLTLVINNSLNDPLFTTTHWSENVSLKKGKNRVTCFIPRKFLNLGTYNISLYVIINFETILHLPSILQFIINNDKRTLGEWLGKEPGYILPRLKWNIVYDS